MMIDRYNATFYKKMCDDYICVYESFLNCLIDYDNVINTRKILLEQYYMGNPSRFKSPEDINQYILDLIMKLIEAFKNTDPNIYNSVISKLNKILNKNRYYAKKVNIKTPEDGMTLSDLDYYNTYLQLKDILNLVMAINRTINY